MKDKLLIERLREYAEHGRIPMHMPGHKRSTAYKWLQDLSAKLDITEIDGFDDVIEADIYDGIRTFIGVNGSTGGIISAVHTVIGAGDRVLIARNCHRSVYHACEICGADTRYIMPEWDEKFGVFKGVDPSNIARTLEEAGRADDGRTGIKAVILTSPTYEGTVSDISRAARICRENGAVLIVDEAHGAHFGQEGFPESAIAQGADIVIQSLHKTLPSLTQTSAIHVRDGAVSADEFKRKLLMFQTSSPSFLLMASAEAALNFLGSEAGAEDSRNWIRRIGRLRGCISGLSGLVLRETDDPSKLLIRTALPGSEFMEILRSYNIEAEMCEQDCVLLMTGAGDTDDNIEAVAEALARAEELLPELPEKTYEAPTIPEKMINACEAVRGMKKLLPVGEAAGRISAQYLWAYPPGIPYLVPGEVVDAAVIEKAVANGQKELYTLT